ncbi:Nn.00g043490.m01.CDS01 [Neocucurbitaria sp. VM-36]
MANGVPNVWTQMNYVPPRGQCNYKQSVLSPKCPCLRFMLHPLKSSSSYECDGCAHHASFHSMENKSEDELRKRWEQEAREKAEREGEAEAQSRPKKRVRAIEYNNSNQLVSENELQVIGTGSLRGTAKTKGAIGKKTGRAAGVRARNAVTEIAEDEDVVELN